MSVFDAVVLADSPHARIEVLGLTLVERGRRVAKRAGARRVFVVENKQDFDALLRWDDERGDAALLIMRAGDQVVHTPLIEALLRGTAKKRIATGPEGYSGAIWLEASAARAVLEELHAGTSDVEIALRGDTEVIPHGDIAVHPATTNEERATAAKMLMKLLVKPEDNPFTRYIYRPISRPLTRMLVGTPVTPNQISIVVLVIGMLGCWFTARPGQQSLIIGAALVLLAGFIDGSDGEIARLRLTSSKLGAWLDTIVDELTTTVYFVAAGAHVYQHHPARWVIPSIIVGLVCYLVAIYGIYYFLVVVSKTGNSQHYVGDLEIVQSDDGPALRPKHRAPSNAPRWLLLVGTAIKHVVRRDFINLGALALTFVNAYMIIYVGMLLGGIVTAVIVIPEHLRLRSQIREVFRRGGTPRLVTS